MTTLVKKISVKGIAGVIKAPPVGQQRDIAIVLGYARRMETKTTSYGDAIAFHGDFKGINVETGEEFRAAICYLPDVAASMLENAMADAPDSTVEFGFKISVIGVKSRNSGDADKYEYRVEPLLKFADTDPVTALENRIKQAALPAPKGKK